MSVTCSGRGWSFGLWSIHFPCLIKRIVEVFRIWRFQRLDNLVVRSCSFLFEWSRCSVVENVHVFHEEHLRFDQVTFFQTVRLLKTSSFRTNSNRLPHTSWSTDWQITPVLSITSPLVTPTNSSTRLALFSRPTTYLRTLRASLPLNVNET